MSGSNFGLADPVVVNPLAAQTTALEAAGKVYQLRQQQSKEAAGQAFQNSLNPDGTPNQSAFLSNLKANPLAAMSALETSQQGQTLDANTYKLHTERLSRANDAVGTLIGRYPNGIPKDAAHAAIQQELDSGLITPQVAQSLRTMFGDNPQQNSIAATQLYSHNMNTQQQLDRRYGTRQAVPAGGSTEIVTVPPPGPGQPNVSVTHTPTPAERYNLTPSYIPLDENGQQTTPDKAKTWQAVSIPRQGVGDMPPAGPASVTTTPGTGAPTAPPPIPPPPGTTPRGAGGGTGGAAAPSAPAAAAKPPVVVTAPPMGVPEAQRKLAEDSAAAATALTTRADQVPTAKANYSNMMADLDAIRSGPGTEREKNINAFVQKWTGRGFTMTPEQVASAENFGKLANVIVGQQLAALGGTDARQQLFMGSNPNLELSKLGNARIINMLKGNEDAIAAKSRAWQDWRSAGHGPDSYASFQNEFNKRFDPRVFQAVYMDPQEIAALRKSMKPEEQKKFLDDYDHARAQKWIP